MTNALHSKGIKQDNVKILSLVVYSTILLQGNILFTGYIVMVHMCTSWKSHTYNVNEKQRPLIIILRFNCLGTSKIDHLYQGNFIIIYCFFFKLQF